MQHEPSPPRVEAMDGWIVQLLIANNSAIGAKGRCIHYKDAILAQTLPPRPSHVAQERYDAAIEAAVQEALDVAAEYLRSRIASLVSDLAAEAPPPPPRKLVLPRGRP